MSDEDRGKQMAAIFEESRAELRKMQEANAASMGEPVQIVHIYKTNVWIENDVFGARHVMIQHETCKPFTYCTFNYDYAYTSNAGTHHAAEAMAISLGATQPVDHRHRTFKPSGGRNE